MFCSGELKTLKEKGENRQYQHFHPFKGPLIFPSFVAQVNFSKRNKINLDEHEFFPDGQPNLNFSTSCDLVNNTSCMTHGT